MKKFLLCAFILFSTSSIFAATLGGVKNKKTGSSGSVSASFPKQHRWTFRPAVNFGYNKLLSGYDGYDDLGNAGLDLYMRRESLDDAVSWGDNLFFRLSVDYFPLQVPQGLNGIQEDLYAANLSILYDVHKLGRFQLPYPWFLGAGYGVYRDKVTLSNNTSGKVSTTHTFNGFVLSTGFTIPPLKYFPFKLVPEIRYHRYKRLKGNASNMTYQLGVVLWPREKK